MMEKKLYETLIKVLFLQFILSKPFFGLCYSIFEFDKAASDAVHKTLKTSEKFEIKQAE